MQAHSEGTVFAYRPRGAVRQAASRSSHFQGPVRSRAPGPVTSSSAGFLVNTGDEAGRGSPGVVHLDETGPRWSGPAEEVEAV